MRSNEQIKSLSKGLNVLIAINELAPVRITTLVERTHLPKPTLVRIVRTLVAEGFVKSRAKEEGGGYVPTPQVRLLASAFAQGTQLAQVGQSVLGQLCEQVKWPADLLVRDGLSMVIEASNRLIAPLRLKRFEQKRFPLHFSSAGLAYMAMLPKAELQDLMSGAPDLVDGKPALTQAHLQTRLEQVRRRGYAIWDYDAPIQGTRVYSVPVMIAERAIAVLTLITLRELVTIEKFEATLLAHLQRAALQISEQVVLLE